MSGEVRKIFEMIKKSKGNEFRLVANESGNLELECYIHPMDENGETVDFTIKNYISGAEILPNHRITTPGEEDAEH